MSLLVSRVPLLQLAAAAFAGALASWVVPAGWFPYAFTGSIVLTLALGVVAACRAGPGRLPNSVLEVVSYLAVGTSSPTSKVPAGAPLRLFLLAATFTAGIGVGVVLLAMR